MNNKISNKHLQIQICMITKFSETIKSQTWEKAEHVKIGTNEDTDLPLSQQSHWTNDESSSFYFL